VHNYHQTFSNGTSGGRESTSNQLTLTGGQLFTQKMADKKTCVHVCVCT